MALNTHYFPEIITKLSFKRFARNTARKHPDQPNTHSSGKTSETDLSAHPILLQENRLLWLPWLLLWILHFHLPGYLLQSLHIPLQRLHFLKICVSWVCPEGKLAVIQSLLEKEECYKTAILVTCSYLRMSEILSKFKQSRYYLSHQIYLRGAHVRPGCFGSYWKTNIRSSSFPVHLCFLPEWHEGWAGGDPGWAECQRGSMAGHPLEQTCPAANMQLLTLPWGFRDQCPHVNWSRKDIFDVFVLKIHLLWGHTVWHSRHWLVPLSQPCLWVELVLYLPW